MISLSMTTSTIGRPATLFSDGVGDWLFALTDFIPVSYPKYVSLGSLVCKAPLVYSMTFRHAATSSIDRGGDLPSISTNALLKELNMNLLKKLFAIFTVVSMALAYIARPFLLLLSMIPETPDDEGVWYSSDSGMGLYGRGLTPGESGQTFHRDKSWF